MIEPGSLDNVPELDVWVAYTVERGKIWPIFSRDLFLTKKGVNQHIRYYYGDLERVTDTDDLIVVKQPTRRAKQKTTFHVFVRNSVDNSQLVDTFKEPSLEKCT